MFVSFALVTSYLSTSYFFTSASPGSSLSCNCSLPRKEMFNQESCYQFLIGSYQMPSKGILFLWHLNVKNFEHTEKLEELCSEHTYTHHLDSVINSFLFALSHIPIIGWNSLQGFNRVDFEGEWDWYAVRYKFLFWTLYLQLTYHHYPPGLGLVVLEGRSRVKAASDLNCTTGSIFSFECSGKYSESEFFETSSGDNRWLSVSWLQCPVSSKTLEFQTGFGIFAAWNYCMSSYVF